MLTEFINGRAAVCIDLNILFTELISPSHVTPRMLKMAFRVSLARKLSSVTGFRGFTHCIQAKAGIVLEDPIAWVQTTGFGLVWTRCRVSVRPCMRGECNWHRLPMRS